jgi:hypothetical protein
MAMIKYQIDNINLLDYGIRVSDTKGLLDLPKMKRPLTTDWPDRYGEHVDLSAPRFESREIVMTCYLKTSSQTEFLTRINNFYTQRLISSGAKQLLVEYAIGKPLVFMVYAPHGLDMKRETRWNAQKMIGTFLLKLREAEPFKKTYRFIASPGNMKVTLNFTTTREATVYWGDGQFITTTATEVSLEHTYATAGTYYIPIVGYVQDIIVTATNATLIWNLQ